MSVWLWILVGAASLGVAWWVLNLVLIARVFRRVPFLDKIDATPPETWPKLSIVIPACNEARDIEAATRSRLDEGYPNLEVVLVNDRSTDATGEIMDRIAADDPRVRVLHIDELPDGWLGKVHALQRGYEIASGQWLLFSDADVHHKPGAMRKAIAYCEQRGVDHLGAIPHFWSTTFSLDCAIAVFMRLICIMARPWAVEDPRSTAAIGVGAFNLVRRTAFEQTGGFEELRLTVVDDVALGQMMKNSGARCAVVNACRHVGLYFYRSLAEAARGTEKSVMVTFNFSYVRLVAVTALLWWVEVSPVVVLLAACWTGALFSGPGAALWIVGGVGLGLALLSSLLAARWARVRLVPAIFFPLGVTLAVGAVARAAILAALRGGHQWRGVVYSTKELQKGNRLKFP